MLKQIIAIDVDQPLIETGKYWMTHLRSNYMLKPEFKFVLPTTLPYNLTKLFEIPEGESGFEWFNDFKLYDGLKPREDALHFVSLISQLHEVIFVSKVIGNHFCSKVEWINKHFPKNEGIYCVNSTKKHIDCDVFIDDSVVNLNEMHCKGLSVDCIRFRRDYDEKVEELFPFRTAYNWEEIYNWVK